VAANLKSISRFILLISRVLILSRLANKNKKKIVRIVDLSPHNAFFKTNMPSDTVSSTKASLCLIHKGTYAKIIKFALPRVETFTISCGWDDGKANAFSKAVDQVVVQNPILTSHLVWKKNALYASPGTYTTENHSFVSIDEDPSISIENDFVSHEARIDFINTHLAPKVGNEKKRASEDIKTKRPLFHAHLFRFANGHACYYVGISHALVDGWTYYQIIDQISSFMSGQDKMPLINWGNPALATHEVVPDHYSKRDLRRIGILPLLLGFMRISLRKKREQIWILNRADILRLKEEQLDTKTTEYLSSHDVIVSTICRLVQSSDEVIVNMDQRVRDPLFKANDGGNCLKHLAIPCDVGSNPNAIRKAVTKGYYYEANQVDGKALRKGRVCYTTSWVTGFKCIQGLQTICHCPSVHFVRSIPGDIGILFSIDDENFGLIHNFFKINEAELAKTKWIKVVSK
jgi:hypothetical protein